MASALLKQLNRWSNWIYRSEWVSHVRPPQWKWNYRPWFTRWPSTAVCLQHPTTHELSCLRSQRQGMFCPVRCVSQGYFSAWFDMFIIVVSTYGGRPVDACCWVLTVSIAYLSCSQKTTNCVPHFHYQSTILPQDCHLGPGRLSCDICSWMRVECIPCPGPIPKQMKVGSISLSQNLLLFEHQWHTIEFTRSRGVS